MKKRFAALLLFVSLIFSTVVPVCAEAVQEYPEAGRVTVDSEQTEELPDQELIKECPDPELTEDVSDSADKEDESDPELTEDVFDSADKEDEFDPDLTEGDSESEYMADESNEELTEDRSDQIFTEKEYDLEYVEDEIEPENTANGPDLEFAEDNSDPDYVKDNSDPGYAEDNFDSDYTEDDSGPDYIEDDFGLDYPEGNNNIDANDSNEFASDSAVYAGTVEDPKDITADVLPRQVTPVVTLEKDAYVFDGTEKRPSVTVTVDPPAGASSDNGSGGNTSTKPWGDAIELPAIPIDGRASSQALGSSLSENYSEDARTGAQTELQTDTEAVSEDREFAGQGQDSSAPILLNEGDDYDVSYPEDCVRAGTYTVTVTLKGNYAGTGEAQFTISPRDLPPEITLTRNSCTYNGKTRKPGVIVTFDGKELIKNTDYTVKYENNINAGTAAAVVTGKGDFTGTVRRSFEILPRKIKPDVTLSKTSFTYNGKTQKPAVTVEDHGTKLASSNYTITYMYGDKASDCKNAGTYKVTVRLKGNYSGSNTVSYKITARKITPAVTLAKTVYTWDGKAQKPAVTVKDGNTKLASANYTVTYASGRKNVGTYKVTVKLKGNYSGSKTVSFRIDPRGTTLTALSAASGAFTASWKKQTAQTTGYQIQYSTSSSFKSGNKSVTVKGASAVSKKIAKLGAGKTYYVRIRTYRTVGEKNYYSAWSAKKSVKTKK